MYGLTSLDHLRQSTHEFQSDQITGDVMPKLEVLDEIMRKNMLMWPCLEHDDAPWTPMSKPLSESKVALVTTAGLHVRGDKPFIATQPGGDTSFLSLIHI